jgi:hypothetical protein
MCTSILRYKLKVVPGISKDRKAITLPFGTHGPDLNSDVSSLSDLDTNRVQPTTKKKRALGSLPIVIIRCLHGACGVMCTLAGRVALVLSARLLQSAARKCRIKACLMMKVVVGPEIKVHVRSVLKEAILQILRSRGTRNCWCDA